MNTYTIRIAILCIASLLSTLLQAETRSFSYDANGNRTFNGITDETDASVAIKKNRHYEFNEANLLARVYSKDGGAECTLARYHYNYRHSLEVKVVYGAQCDPSIAYVEYFSFDPSDDVFYKITKDGLGNTVKEEEFLRAAGNLLATHNATSGYTTYYVNNHLGSVVASFDENGDVIERVEYAPFGGLLSAITNENTFLGKVLEQDLSMINLDARMHDPLTRQFLTPDTAVPLAINQARATVRGGVDASHLTYRDTAHLTNPYAYGRNSPATYVDRDGNVIFLAPIAIFVAKEIAVEVASRTASHYTGGASDVVANVLSTRRAVAAIGKASAKFGNKYVKVFSQIEVPKGTVGNSKLRNGHLAGQNHPITGIPFDKNGFPDFSSVTKADVNIKPTGNRRKDFKAANEQAGYNKTPEGYTWHHHQSSGRMQLVQTEVHQKTGHTGGFSLNQ